MSRMFVIFCSIRNPSGNSVPFRSVTPKKNHSMFSLNEWTMARGKDKFWKLFCCCCCLPPLAMASLSASWEGEKTISNINLTDHKKFEAKVELTEGGTQLLISECLVAFHVANEFAHQETMQFNHLQEMLQSQLKPRIC